MVERQIQAGRDDIGSGGGNQLCKARFLRIADLGADRCERPFPALTDVLPWRKGAHCCINAYGR